MAKRIGRFQFWFAPNACYYWHRFGVGTGGGVEAFVAFWRFRINLLRTTQ